MKVNSAMRKVAIQSIKDIDDLTIYSIPMTELGKLSHTFDSIKRDIKSQTTLPKDILIIVAVK